MAQTLDDEEDGFDAKLWVLALASRRGLCGGCTCVCADGCTFSSWLIGGGVGVSAATGRGDERGDAGPIDIVDGSLPCDAVRGMGDGGAEEGTNELVRLNVADAVRNDSADASSNAAAAGISNASTSPNAPTCTAFSISTSSVSDRVVSSMSVLTRSCGFMSRCWIFLKTARDFSFERR